MKLSSRLQAIADFVPQNTIVGDIGTDHGYIPVYLMENGVTKKVIATDLSKNSLEKINLFVRERKLENYIDIRLGNGLEVLKPFEIDTVVIAGMGGLLIRDILDKDKEKRDSITNFILQPNIATKELRKYLYENNFEIIDEKLVKEDDKFYEVIYAKKGKSHIEHSIYYEIGEKLILNDDSLLKEFLEEKVAIIEKILQELKDKNTERSKERYKELSNKIRDLKVVLKKIESNRDY
ncbi:tRNA (adenine(22)-N(1))-methyltransferase [Clostridium sp. Cult2]|uniref:tRNA (adenine(22)-N(1))-methyltransferase n=1 Tax=Clostridium sp. Cult2 TaxID=2079003 RepID=UPI001F0282B7|nr:tRNA (adenine(22)-N(1))-methyltransferase TrmK [Clostridium sp. Cult2]MCF6466545.1 SAM-dependent methyltransferase [Clostridium sp. Cult2]